MKRFLISLFVGLIGLVSFGYCDNVENLITYVSDSEITISSHGSSVIYNIDSSDYGVYCLDIYSWSDSSVVYLDYGRFSSPADPPGVGNYLSIYEPQNSRVVCIDVNQPYVGFVNPYSKPVSIGYRLYRLDVLLDTPLPVMTSLQCQSEYSLIPISQIDTNYCVGNGFCPAQDFSGLSNLYVNDILFMSSSIYSLNIPEEFDFDYTGNENLLEIDVKGYNTDPDYIAGIISTQGNRPNNEFFNSIITDLIPKFVPGLVIILFIYFAFRFIKKVF